MHAKSTRTECQCNARLSQPSLPRLPGLKKSALQALYEKKLPSN